MQTHQCGHEMVGPARLFLGGKAMRTSFGFFRFAGIVLALALFAGINAMADTMAFSVPCPSTCL
jgi:hypothetical protein